jgi:hypothetical protein
LCFFAVAAAVVVVVVVVVVIVAVVVVVVVVVLYNRKQYSAPTSFFLLPRFLYSLGYAGFDIFNNRHFHAALNAINPVYGDHFGVDGQKIRGENTLTVWNISHRHLDAADAFVYDAIKKMAEDAPGRALLTDGWDGLQRRHVLNALVTTAISEVFVANIYTGEVSVTAVFQSNKLLPIIIEWDVDALCSDNASVMRKTWRILRLIVRLTRARAGKGGRWFITYGCSTHSINLWQKDFLKLAVRWL